MYAIEMKGITKRFGPVLANDKVDFELIQGEVHALLGENGAGKTTLMRILYGLYQEDDGEIIIKGEKSKINSPKDAIAKGIGMVSQHFTLVPPLSVAENIVLGFNPGLRMNPREIEQKVKAASQRFGVSVKPSALVRHLSVGERQRVEILKALYRNIHVLILDEPTAVLVPQEVEILFETLLRLRKEGLSIIFISHKLNEVMTISDRITVLRDGRCIGTVAKKDSSENKLAKMMVGRETFGVTRQLEKCAGKPVLEVKNITALSSKGLVALKDISFTVCENEILGIAGVSGNGQSELGRVLSGILKPSAGHVLLGAKEISKSSPAEITRLGVGRIPEDRHEGVVNELTVEENLALETLEEYTRNSMMNWKKVRANAIDLIKQYQIKARPTDETRKLSGGNMQKVILARALSRKPKLVIAAQPTRGLDVGATEYVRNRLLEEKRKGAAVLLISEDLEEILTLSDRIAVMYEGRMVGVMDAGDATEEKLGLLMCGAKEMTNEV
jgi:general nucleoside transport system ATP-binding protein